jgi:hypothetical protein
MTATKHFQWSEDRQPPTIQPFKSASGEARQYTVSPEQVRVGDWNL